MTDEQREINRRVAVKLGYRAVCITERDVWHGTIRGMVPEEVLVGVSPRPGGNAGMPQEIPPFCNDPAAADAVRIEIERRGWGMSADEYLDADDGYRFREWGVVVPAKPKGRAYYRRGEGRYDALCLAFLAACEAEENTT
jgi:hypothetical protein